MRLSSVPLLNACLNGSAGVLLVTGYVFVKRGQFFAHKVCMLSALSCSAVFLAGYLYYHFRAGVVYYHGAWRAAYFSILGTHTVLAAIIAPLAIYTASLALRGRFELHKKWAKRALPIWLYVSVTGVVIYAMLFGI
ncbi:MAG: DUF420 domain-containing protein [Elusimicrobia bacterium]|nr:DUF420 domain-containing protein [Elusimicrobiota bacterium]MDE2313859.1 DUF420 domain-containing protein [Elusimicrobiota bacterium]